MNQRERIISIGAGVVLAAFALDSFFITPLMTQADEAQAGIDAAELEQTEAETQIERGLNAARNWNKISRDTVPDTYGAAEQQLSNLIPLWASAARMNLTSLTPEPGEAEQGFGTLTFRAVGNGNLDSVGRFLYQVELAEVPARVSLVSLSTQTDGTDDLIISLGISTLYELPEEQEDDVPRRSR